jgi:hypothetical protein
VEKVMKIIMVFIMLLGIALSISNFISFELNAADSLRGVWVGTECEGDGNECDIGIEEPV